MVGWREREVSPLKIWLDLHADARTCSEKQSDEEIKRVIDKDNFLTLKKLSDFPAERWQKICEGVDWTTYGAVTLSWCAEAKIEDVIVAWREALDGNIPDKTELRPARFLNPALLPEPKLSKIIEMADGFAGTWLLLAAFKGSGTEVERDLPADKLADLNRDLAKLL